MKKHILAFVCVLGLSACMVQFPEAYALQKPQDAPLVEATPPVKVTLAAFPPDKYTSTNFPVRVIFENTSDKNLTLFRGYERTGLNPVDAFFRFNITRPDGRRIPTPITATSDGRFQDYRYITLWPGETFGTTLNLAETLSCNPTQPLLAGDYEIVANYHNRYGEDCFHGSADPSEPIKLHLSKTISFTFATD